MGDSGLVVVQTFSSRPEADIAVSALEAAGHRIDDSRGRWRESAARPRVGRRRVPGRREGRGFRRGARDSRDPRAPGSGMSNGRVADYDRIADKYDRRYDLHAYAGVKDALFNSLDSGTVSAALEVGCGTGHWLAEIRRQYPSAERLLLAGVEPAAGMLSRAQAANPDARLVRARAEALPWRDATFDRVFCVNALHHFADRVRFFHEARRDSETWRRAHVDRQGPARRPRHVVGLRLLSGDADDRSRSLRARARPPGRTRAGRLCLGGVVRGGPYRSRHAREPTPSPPALWTLRTPRS